jgi:hypothetical protein
MLYVSNLSLFVIIRWLTLVGIAVIDIIFTVPAHAQQEQNRADGVIYTCTDATGRKITADRPIATCIDRDQQILSNQGWVIKVVPPALTDAQRAAQKETERQAQLAQQRQHEQDRFNDALLIRYPTQAVHEAGRRAALAQTQSLIGNTKQQLATLENERADLATQMAVYAEYPERAPAQIKRRIMNNAQAIQAQQQLMAGYQAEIERINAQFDAEDKHLTAAWQKTPLTPAATETRSK